MYVDRKKDVKKQAVPPVEAAYDIEKIMSLKSHPGWAELQKFIVAKTRAAVRKCLSPDLKRVDDLQDLGFHRGIVKAYEWQNDLVNEGRVHGKLYKQEG